MGAINGFGHLSDWSLGRHRKKGVKEKENATKTGKAVYCDLREGFWLVYWGTPLDTIEKESAFAEKGWTDWFRITLNRILCF